MNRFRPKTTNKGMSKTLLKSYDFGQMKKKTALAQRNKNKDLVAIQKLHPSGKSSLVTKSIDEIS